MTPGEPSVPHLAATVVLLRTGPDGGPEVLLTQRPSTMAFAADLHVFPGGRVDPGDIDDPEDGAGAPSARSAEEAAAALGGNESPKDALALHRAALRELSEEAGIDLGDGQLLRTDLLVPIAHWVTPRFMPRRFSTWFFAADLPAFATPVFAPDEVVAHRWVTPLTALDQMAAGEIAMWAPTSSTLQRLVETSAGSAAELVDRITIGRATPPRIVEDRPGLVRLVVGGAGGLPGRAAEVRILGDRRLVIVDPGDPSDAAVDAILGIANRRAESIGAIVLTTPGPDRAAGAEALAIPLEIPILVAPGAGRHLSSVTRELADGEALPSDVAIRVRLGPPGSGRLAVEVGSTGE